MKRIEWVMLFGLVLLALCATSTYAESPREQLKQMVEQLQKSPSDNTLREKIIRLAQQLKPAPAVPEEAERFEGRAQFAFKNAKSPADYLDAAREYEKAVAAAPWVSGYYADLCTIYEKAEKYAEAKKSCEFFLASSPSAQDASDVRKRIAGLEFAIEKTGSPEAQAARQAEVQREKDAALKKSLDGAVFVRRGSFDYGAAEWKIRISVEEATYSYEVIEFASDNTVPAGVRGTWRQILINSGYSGSRMDLAYGRITGKQFTLVRTVSTPGFEAGSMPCEVATDTNTITCSGDLIGGKTWVFQRR